VSLTLSWAKVSKNLDQKTSLAWWYMAVIPGRQEEKVGRLQSKAGSQAKKDKALPEKNNKAKKVGGMAQVIENFPKKA
jgi:hypothetical protein